MFDSSISEMCTYFGMEGVLRNISIHNRRSLEPSKCFFCKFFSPEPFYLLEREREGDFNIAPIYDVVLPPLSVF
jgi:hypothetical protein